MSEETKIEPTDDEVAEQIESGSTAATTAPPVVGGGNFDKGLSKLQERQAELERTVQANQAKIDANFERLNQTLAGQGSKPLTAAQQNDVEDIFKGMDRVRDFPTVGQTEQLVAKLRAESSLSKQQIDALIKSAVAQEVAPLAQKLQVAESAAQQAAHKAHWAEWAQKNPSLTTDERDLLWKQAEATAKEAGDTSPGYVRATFDQKVRIAVKRKADGKKSVEPRTTSAPPSSAEGTQTHKPGATSAGNAPGEKKSMEQLTAELQASMEKNPPL